jgi:hypothetical protein
VRGDRLIVVTDKPDASGRCQPSSLDHDRQLTGLNTRRIAASAAG